MILPPTVCLDGAAVRRIREEKKLTQLYVAKVVGVTTDTISRWENNRYPTVRRENLQKLGEALEVPLDWLVKKDDTVGCDAELTGGDFAGETAAPPSSLKLWLGGLLVVLLLGSGLVYYFLVNRTKPAAAPDFSGSRLLPRYAAPGTVIPVRLRLAIADPSRGYIVREHFPAGWELIEASPPASSIDNEDGMARWIVKQGDVRESIAYLLRVDARSPQKMVGRFRGEIIGNLEDKNLAVTVEGAGATEVAPFNWADQDGDFRIDDNEMLEASQAFEEMEGVHLDWRQLESLWDAGRYRYDTAARRFLPEKNP